MAKKKNKTQKYKKNIKKKQQKAQTAKNTNNKQINNNQQSKKTTQPVKNKQVVPKNEVKYNVVLNNETAKKDKPVQKTINKETPEKKETKNTLSILKVKVKTIKDYLVKKINQIVKNHEFKKNNKKKTDNKYNKKIKKDIPNIKKIETKSKELKLTIQSLIATYPLYSQEDILVLHTLAPYADPEVFKLINHFLYPNSHNEGNSTHKLLLDVLSMLEEKLQVTA